MKREEIKYIIEAVLFAYGDPVSIKDLNNIINSELSAKEIEIMMNALIDEYRENDRGIQILKLEDRYQMCTNDKYADYIKKIMEPQKKKNLSQATMETLTIVAYKQPVTKAEIEDIRGVKCDKAIRTLLDNHLIMEAGRLNRIGKPIIYRTTDDLLKVLDIDSLNQLPSLDNENE